MSVSLFRRPLRILIPSLLVAFGCSFPSQLAFAAPQLFTVTFYSNVPGANFGPVQETASSPISLQAFNTMGFSYANYYFEDWNTESNGSGNTYPDQDVLSTTTDVQLYAQWVQQSHSVVFYGNASPSDTSHQIETANSPTSLTSFSQLGFQNQNYEFKDWNTQSDGSGTVYKDQQIYSFVSGLNLYAQWSPAPETLSFSPGSGSGSQSSVISSYGSKVVLPLGASMSRSDYSLSGWNTKADGSGVEYKPGASFTVGVSETLYATWSRNHDRISFVPQVGKSKVAPVTALAGNSIHLPSVAKIKNPGHSFVGWFSAASGGKLVGRSGTQYVPSKSMTLYAHWADNPLVHLEFSNNGGVGHIPARSVLSGQSVVIPSGTQLHRAGFSFRGWASSPRASGPTVFIGSHLVVTKTKILYALWRRALPADTPQTLLGSISIFAPNSSVLTPAMRHAVALVAIGINQRNRTLVLLYGYATSKDSAHGSALLSLQRALAVEKQLTKDLEGLNDVGVTIRAAGEGRLTNSVLASFRDVEIFAN